MRRKKSQDFVFFNSTPTDLLPTLGIKFLLKNVKKSWLISVSFSVLKNIYNFNPQNPSFTDFGCSRKIRNAGRTATGIFYQNPQVKKKHMTYDICREFRGTFFLKTTGHKKNGLFSPGKIKKLTYPSEKTLYQDEFFQTFGRAFSSFDEGEIEANGDSVRVDVADVAYIFLVTKMSKIPGNRGF